MAAQDWNVVVTVHPDGYRAARHLLAAFGEVSPTGFYNVLVLEVPDLARFCERLSTLYRTAPESCEVLSRVAPCQETFNFETVEVFERQAEAIVAGWAPRLADTGFHVRMHRRGSAETLSTRDEERWLDQLVLDRLRDAGKTARVDFEAPAFILSVETVDRRAGLSLWSREELERHPFLGLD